MSTPVRTKRRRARNGAPVVDRIALWTDVNEQTGCWNWTGGLRRGYGTIAIDGKLLYSHRVAYEALVGPIPDGLQLDHLCRNRACCNPNHLEPVTGAENVRRAAAVITHCPQGHRYDEANTRYGTRGRACRRCNREYVAARRAADRIQTRTAAADSP